MTNYEKIKQMCAEEMAKEKISVDKIEIIVRNTDEKSYYSLKYYDIKDKQEYIGFSSYDLDIVLNYIKNCFVILERENIADIHPVIHARWIKRLQTAVQKWTVNNNANKV